MLSTCCWDVEGRKCSQKHTQLTRAFDLAGQRHILHYFINIYINSLLWNLRECTADDHVFQPIGACARMFHPTCVTFGSFSKCRMQDIEHTSNRTTLWACALGSLQRLLGVEGTLGNDVWKIAWHLQAVHGKKHLDNFANKTRFLGCEFQLCGVLSMYFQLVGNCLAACSKVLQ